ncbi:serine hydrolase domain-containing protein [Steroidobacter sp.]|uniref:serine hydrolase domain-containing protein n=1 Tax=Steroidobacter sp. TaxID=1978227 RepID=UPI001A45D970|nr:serine hydrolase domain-containing protein [Steroidobacter sp.]MBL8268161.1 beta-lactamase family protein [Steroidobacter sp.]
MLTNKGWNVARRATLVSAWLCVSGVAFASAPTLTAECPEQLDTLLAEYSSTRGPGLAVGVYSGATPLCMRGYGMADLENAAPIGPDTIFPVASMSKHFTAFAVLLLASEGKVDLDADIRKYLPYVPGFGVRITARHLIYHTSGIRDQESLFNFSGLDDASAQRQKVVLNWVQRQRALNFSPGTDHAYNNTGYTLLAELVQAVSGKTLREFSDERIFGPLQMRDTHFSDRLPEIVARRAESYARPAGTTVWQRKLLNQETVGATGLRTTVRDLARWAGNFAKPVVGDATTLREFITPGALDDGAPLVYGFGLYRGPVLGRDTVSHDGAEAGYRSTFLHFIDEDVSVAVLSNRPVNVAGLAEKIAALYLVAAESPLSPPLVSAIGGATTSQLGSVEPLASDGARAAKLAAALVGHYAAYAQLLRFERRGDVVGLTSGDSFTPIVFRTDGTFDLGDEERRKGDYYKVINEGSRIVALVDGKVGGEGRPARYSRVQPIDPAHLDLRPFVGTYRSTELDVSYSVYIDGDTLKARALLAPEPLTLKPLYQNAFSGGSWTFGHIAFERKGKAHATALIFSNERARNVRFGRVP